MTCSRTSFSAIYVFTIVTLLFASFLFIPGHGEEEQYNRLTTFNIPKQSPVAMLISPTAHYGLDTSESDDEWASLIPPGGHTISVDNKTYTVSLLHQMKCLDILRQEYLSPQVEVLPPLARHCLIYLRSMVYCQSNSRIESAHSVSGTADRTYDAVCQDWSLLYDEIERVQAMEGAVSRE